MCKVCFFLLAIEQFDFIYFVFQKQEGKTKKFSFFASTKRPPATTTTVLTIMIVMEKG
jgi:hypothetical protein